ncbi:TRAP transporter small permease subunit (plasmid) [Desulfolutivibrio sulfoxidireducens]|nr:TRAP transporter small permease subunit [Desulfolutivibrio sulfoxidireducens]
MNMLFTILKWLDANVEKAIIIISYFIMSMIVFVEVIKRFCFGTQSPWSTEIPIYLFLMLAWIGCAYNAKVRTHLTFSDVRSRLPRFWQFFCLILDYICWVSLAVIVIYYTVEQVAISRNNYAMITGTDIYVWYFYMSTPLGWALTIYRVTQNLFKDIRNYRNGRPLIETPDFAAAGE